MAPGEVGGIRVEVSPGELIDRITTLQIKIERIQASAKRERMVYALGVMCQAPQATLPDRAGLQDLEAELKRLNEALWEIEDEIRACEAAQNFGPRFIALARSVYRTNDQRAAAKKAIDALFGSALTDEKVHPSY